MHAECFQFVSQFATHDPLKIVEIGSRDINGTVRPLFPGATYTGLDLMAGPAVDVVCDALEWSPQKLVDIVLCLEVLEHAPMWDAIIDHAFTWLRPDGRIIITCAGPGRPEHSAVDGGPLRPGEYYRNLTDTEIAEALMAAGFGWIDCAAVGHDIQAVACVDSRHPRPKRQAEIDQQYRYETQ